jgi:hypothetical protein
MTRGDALISAASVIGPDWREDAYVRRLADDCLMLARRGPPRIVLGVFEGWQEIDLYMAREAARIGAMLNLRRRWRVLVARWKARPPPEPLYGTIVPLAPMPGHWISES